MTDPNKTAILVVLDRSGSMNTITDDVVGAFAAFVKEQREQPGSATLSLVQFDTEYEEVYLNKPLDEVPLPLVHQPRGGTALFDAMGKGIVNLGAKLASQPEDERPSKVIVVTMTDGYENSSKEWTQESLKAKIEEQRSKYNWEFVFTAANIDAHEYAQNLGIAHSANFVANSAGVQGNIGGMSRGISSYRKGTGYDVSE